MKIEENQLQSMDFTLFVASFECQKSSGCNFILCWQVHVFTNKAHQTSLSTVPDTPVITLQYLSLSNMLTSRKLQIIIKLYRVESEERIKFNFVVDLIKIRQ